MKRLLIALAFLPLAANAEIVAKAPNNLGGQIFLTTSPCTDKTWRLVSTAANGEVVAQGCFAVTGGQVVVLWDNQKLSVFSTDLFEDAK